MKESSWKDCVDENSALSVSVDEAKAKSLVDVSRARVEFLKKTQVHEDNANFIFEGYYSSVVELLHALVLLHGFKVSNYVCLGYFLRDVLKDQKLYRIFDDFRYKRNSLVYYGKQMDFEVAKEAINKAGDSISELQILIGRTPNP